MGWETLLEIAEENRAEAASASARIPVSCPLDGAPLDVRGDVRNCPMGNYRWEAGIGGQVLDDPGVVTFGMGGF